MNQGKLMTDEEMSCQSVEISKEDYKKIITGVLQERPIEQIGRDFGCN